MYNYLKKILFTLLIIVMPYMTSVSKAMDDVDYEGSSVHSRKVSFITEDGQNVQSSAKQHSQVMSLEDSKVSWTSSFSSFVMGATHRAYYVLDYTTRNPQKAAIIGFCLAYQVTAVAAICECVCSTTGYYPFMGMGNAADFETCKGMCSRFGYTVSSCAWKQGL